MGRIPRQSSVRILNWPTHSSLPRCTDCAPLQRISRRDSRPRAPNSRTFSASFPYFLFDAQKYRESPRRTRRNQYFHIDKKNDSIPLPILTILCESSASATNSNEYYDRRDGLAATTSLPYLRLVCGRFRGVYLPHRRCLLLLLRRHHASSTKLWPEAQEDKAAARRETSKHRPFSYHWPRRSFYAPLLWQRKFFQAASERRQL
jgi:hypothetical protein